MKQEAHLGKGLKFPVQVNPATGRFMYADGQTSVKESLYLILMTQRQERWIRPDFGSRILSYTFMDTSYTRLNMMSRELEQTILSQEPRISSVDIEVQAQLDKGVLLIDITYTLAETNTRDNLVFPFYLYSSQLEDKNGSME